MLTQIYLAAMGTVFLWYCGTQGYGGITAAKFRTFCVVGVGYVACMALLGAWRALLGPWRLPSLKGIWARSTWAQRAAVGYAAATWVSALCSPYWPQTVWGVSRYEGAATITLYAALFLLVSVYGRPAPWLLWLWGGSLTLFSVLCLAQMAGRNPFGLYPEGYSYLDAGKAYPGSYLGTLGNADLTAAFFSLLIPIFLYLTLRPPGKRRFLLLVPLVLALLAAGWMGVSAGYLGIGAGCVLALPAAGLKGKKRRIAALVLLGLILLGLLALFFWDAGGGMLHEAHQMLHGDFDSRFGSGRVHIWKEVLGKVPEHFLLGAGPDTMLLAELEPFTRYDSRLGGVVVGQIDMAHNEYLNILYHQGIFALACYLAMLACLLRRWVRAAASDPLAAALGAGIVGYCVQALFGFSMCISAPFFWLALGLLEARTAHSK